MFLNNGVQIDELFGQLTKSGSAVVKEVEIRCLDGYELSCDSVSNLTVEAKHDSDVSYTDIEVSAIDVSSFAGSDETFQLRFTPSSTTGVFSFRFRYAPIAPPPPSYSFVYNDDGDEIYNDDSDLVRTLA